MPYLVALIFPNRELLKERVGAHADEAATRKAIHAAIATALADLPSHEQVRRFALLSEALSEANGELTPTLKVKRRVVAEHYAELLAQMGNGKG
jgi:long-chain acyl-CoA synthetase